eukprot:5444669-Prymnesium_polylepis.1
MAACTRGKTEDARRLLELGTDPSKRGDFGATPLIAAAEQGHTAIANLLLQRGAHVADQDDNGDSALLCACRMGQIEVAKLLLAAGADAGLLNKQGNNSLDAALEARNTLGRPEVSQLLLGHRRGDDPRALAQPAAEDTIETQDTIEATIETQAGAPVSGSLSLSALSGQSSSGLAPSVVPRSFTNASLASDVSLSSSRAGAQHTPALRLHREQWAADRNYPQCHLCKSKFNMWNRRHHCRICGLVFCERCSPHSVSTSVSSANAPVSAPRVAPRAPP